MAMTTETNNNEVMENNQEMENTQVAENQQPVQNPPAPEEKKEGFVKKTWNKVKKPLAIAGGIAAAFGLGVATDHFVINKNSSQDGDSTDSDTQSSEGTVE